MRCDLSIVATSRNDDHGGNLLHRMQLFVNGLLEQCRRHQLDAELILVDWNPPPDKPKLKDALSYPVKNGRCNVRIIEVPSEIHQRFKHSDQLPLFQMIAKNVGIRRARADFVLATNIDILVSDELIAFIKSGLKPNTLFRVDRYDVRADLDGARLPTPAECRALPVIREHTLEGMRYPARSAKRRPRTIRRPESVSRLVMAAWDRVVLPRLHTLACGDFTLTSKEIWNSLRGYPE